MLEAGGSDRVIRQRLQSGRWIRAEPRGVYVLAGTADTYLRRLWIAHLSAGRHSVVSHEAAGRLLHLTGHDRAGVVLTVPHPEHPKVPGATVHQISDVAPRHVWRLGELPVTTTPRTIVDLAARSGRATLEVVLDDAIARRRTTQAAVARCVFDIIRPGKRGLDRLLDVLDVRGADHIPPMSELERRLLAAISGAGLPAPIRQFPLPGRGAVTGVVDAAYPEERVILEADGRTWHDRRRAFRADRLRDNEAARVGWQTLRFPWEEVVNDPTEVAATIADVLAQRSRGLHVPPG